MKDFTSADNCTYSVHVPDGEPVTILDWRLCLKTLSAFCIKSWPILDSMLQSDTFKRIMTFFSFFFFGGGGGGVGGVEKQWSYVSQTWSKFTFPNEKETAHQYSFKIIGCNVSIGSEILWKNKEGIISSFYMYVV